MGGWARFNLEGGLARCVEAARRPNEELWATLRAEPPTTLVVVESFRIYKWAAESLVGSDLLEVQCIGRIEEISHFTGFTLWLVPPSAHKALYGIDWLKETGAWSNNGHVNDALTVAWYGLTQWGRKP